MVYVSTPQCRDKKLREYQPCTKLTVTTYFALNQLVCTKNKLLP